MAPLILHNVDESELYVGEDGIQRPYAMVFPTQDGLHYSSTRRRGVVETGSFGKPTRRSRSQSRGPTPAGGSVRRGEDATLLAADRIFGDWMSNQTAATSGSTKTGLMGLSLGPSAHDPDDADHASAAAKMAAARMQPTEMILRGYRSAAQQYAVINHFEQLAGRICEDYNREPPTEQRRYKSELRDRAFTARRPLTAEERVRVNRVAGGKHWVKVTFESSDAAEAAVSASPQRVLGHLVSAERYLGEPPLRDEAVPEVDALLGYPRSHLYSQQAAATPTASRVGKRSPLGEISPPNSKASSQTFEADSVTGSVGIASSTVASSDRVTATLDPFAAWKSTPPTTKSAATTSTAAAADGAEDTVFCRRIPTARRAQLLPSEQALLPQPSLLIRLVNAVPLLRWFGGSMIGAEVPRTETGEFDWNRASLYWKVICWLDARFGLFGGEILNADKDD